MPLDEEKVRAFAAKMFVDLGGASSVALALAGDRLGLWKGMAGAGPLTPAESWPRGPRPRSATCASGCARWPRRST